MSHIVTQYAKDLDPLLLEKAQQRPSILDEAWLVTKPMGLQKERCGLVVLSTEASQHSFSLAVTGAGKVEE